MRVYLKNYPEAYYVLFLPLNFENNTKKWPLIIESPGNSYLDICDGLPDNTYLGYGLTRGKDFIWASVPFIDRNGKMLSSYWGDDPIDSVNYWLAVLDDLNDKFFIDQENIFLSGFSRGAISISYIGNYNETISAKWKAFFAHSHFDGCCQQLIGNLSERINRFNKREILITVGANDQALSCSKGAYEKLLAHGCLVKYIEVPEVEHTASWILEESPSAEKARNWLKSLKEDS